MSLFWQAERSRYVENLKGTSTLNRSLIVLAVFLLTIATARADEPVMKRIFFGSCIKQDRPIPILNTIADQNPDLFIFLGDNIYADTTDMDVMRTKYGKLQADAGFARLIKTCPVLATWDDHDYGVNDGGAEYPRRHESQQIFVDFWNDPAGSPRRKRAGVYDAHVFGPKGKRVQIILLDTRYFRSKLKRGNRRTGGAYVPDPDPNATMLGDAQWAWLHEQLQIPADLRIIATSIQCLPESAGQETWSNLPRERERLFDTIQQVETNGVVLISGDRHWSELSVTEEGLRYPVYEATSSSLNQVHPRGTPTVNRFRALNNTFHRENFGVLDIDWEKSTISIQIRDVEGTIRIRKDIAFTIRKAS